MANLDNATKQKLEHLFDMQTGYVLDFSNSTFQDFILTSVGIDVDIHYQGSKAWKLRQFWQNESDEVVAKLTLEMLERWQTIKLMDNESITNNEQILYDQCKEAMEKILNKNFKPTKSDTDFLNKDIGEVDISKLRVSIDLKAIIKQRLDEIDICLSAKAPLAVIFLCGSTLEGILFEVASKNLKQFNKSKSAPKRNGKIKALSKWTLEELINVSRSLNVIGEDVKKHAHAVKDFRNYIHPRQQFKENFALRMFTAEMANKVLQAAMADLGAKK